MVFCSECEKDAAIRGVRVTCHNFKLILPVMLMQGKSHEGKSDFCRQKDCCSRKPLSKVHSAADNCFENKDILNLGGGVSIKTCTSPI